MVITGIPENGKLKIKSVEKNGNMDTTCNQKSVLIPIFEEDTTKLFPTDIKIIEFHWDKTSRNPTKSIVAIFEKFEREP